MELVRTALGMPSGVGPKISLKALVVRLCYNGYTVRAGEPSL